MFFFLTEVGAAHALSEEVNVTVFSQPPYNPPSVQAAHKPPSMGERERRREGGGRWGRPSLEKQSDLSPHRRSGEPQGDREHTVHTPRLNQHSIALGT